MLQKGFSFPIVQLIGGTPLSLHRFLPIPGHGPEIDGIQIAIGNFHLRPGGIPYPFDLDAGLLVFDAIDQFLTHAGAHAVRERLDGPGRQPVSLRIIPFRELVPGQLMGCQRRKLMAGPLFDQRLKGRLVTLGFLFAYSVAESELQTGQVQIDKDRRIGVRLMKPH